MDTGSNNGSTTQPPQAGPSNATDQAPAIAELVKLVSTLTKKVDVLTDKVQDNSVTVQLSKHVPKRDFKAKGNEVQHSINDCVIDTLDVALSYNEAGQIDKANTFIKDSKTHLVTRNKHIDIAEESEFGFKAVEYYEKPIVASDEADFKRIVRAEALARADHKRSADADYDQGRSYKRSRGNYRGQSRGTFSGFTNYAPPPAPYPYAPTMPYQMPPFGYPQFPPQMPPMPAPYFQQPFPAAPGISQWQNPGSTAYQQPRQSVQRCFTCQQIGHFARNCPQKQQQASAGIPYKR